jgi:hypothetical protein
MHWQKAFFAACAPLAFAAMVFGPFVTGAGEIGIGLFSGATIVVGIVIGAVKVCDKRTSDVRMTLRGTPQSKNRTVSAA